jgi:hypothetical protein
MLFFYGSQQDGTLLPVLWSDVPVGLGGACPLADDPLFGLNWRKAASLNGDDGYICRIVDDGNFHPQKLQAHFVGFAEKADAAGFIHLALFPVKESIMDLLEDRRSG